MKIKELPKKDDIIFPEDTDFNHETSREMDIADLDIQLSELESVPETPFNKEKRKQIEKHRRELIKAQHADKREKLRLAKQIRKEEKRQARWRIKSKEAETSEKLAEERQLEALVRDRKRRARRRKFDSVCSFFGKIVFIGILIVGILCVSNQSVRDRVAITFNNLFAFTQECINDKEVTSNKTINELLKPLGKELNESTKQNKETKTEKTTNKSK